MQNSYNPLEFSVYNDSLSWVESMPMEHYVDDRTGESGCFVAKMGTKSLIHTYIPSFSTSRLRLELVSEDSGFSKGLVQVFEIYCH